MLCAVDFEPIRATRHAPTDQGLAPAANIEDGNE
jgi:hypothetical protein